jgi:AraC-like DNA-binding protein
VQFAPAEILKPFVQKYIAVTISDPLDREIFYPSGYIDLVIKSNGFAATAINGVYKSTPDLELLGHLTLPTTVYATKGTELLIARLHPYSCSLFFNNRISEFTNSATDVSLINSKEATQLYEQIHACPSLPKKISILERYLIGKLKASEKAYGRVVNLSRICNFVTDRSEAFSVKKISSETGVSERYIQKLFLEYVGLQPVSLHASHRFITSLEHIISTSSSLTSIAYACGYYDQAHFVKEFKRFTGISPLQARRELRKNDEANKIAVNVGL